jgi:hypothetical protein
VSGTRSPVVTAPSRATSAGRAFLDLRAKARGDHRPVNELYGYRLLAADGGVFDFGSATYEGSATHIRHQPIVGMAVDPVTGGYWLAAADGGVFSFDAPFYGSMGGKPLDAPVVGVSSMPTGHGYRLVAADGGVFDFGSATYEGSAG